MEKLSQILSADTIKLEMKSAKKKDALRELVAVLEESGKLPEHVLETLFIDLVAREKITSTGIGRGIAIPHKLAKGLDKTVIAFGRKRSGINFGSIDGKPVTLMFLVIGQEDQSTSHLRLLSRLSRLLHDNALREGLLNAENPGDIIAAIEKQEDE